MKWGFRRSVAAETGIGTSIIFVAMILVSSAAGTVIVDTTDTSGQQAFSTVNEVLEDTAFGLEVRGVVGEADVDLSGIVEMDLTVSLIPGSGPLNLSSLTLELITPHGFYAWNGSTGGYIDAERLTGQGTNTSVISKGDLFLLHVPMLESVENGETVTIRLIPATGFSTTIRVDVPDVIPQKYVLLR